MMTNKFYDKQVFNIGIIFGLIGGLLMIGLRVADFGLGYIHGYLFLINYLLIMVIGLAVYKNRANGASTYLKRFSVGLIIYLAATICFGVYSISFRQFNQDRTMQDKLLVPLIVILFGLFLSSIFAFSFKQKKLSGNS